MIASMLFAFSPLIWEYSITAEVFALNNFFCALLLYLTLSIWQTQIAAQSNFNVYIGALVCGLAMSNQHASLLSIGPLILSVVYHLYIRKGTDIISILIPAGFLFLIGLLPYIYLYVATSGGRSVRGSWGDTSSISGMLRHMLRAEYGTFRLGMVTGSETFLERIVLYIKHGSQESYFLLYPLVGIVIFSIGMSFISQHRKNKRNVRGENKFKSKAKPNEIKRSSKKAAIGLENEQDNYDKSPEAAISSNSSNMVSMKIVIATWLFYVSIWHGVLSNLPLNAPMPYGVHARFWMQPDIFVYALAGAGLSLGYTSVSKWTRLQSSSSVSYILPLSGLVLLIGVVLKFRFVVMDKSSLGWVMHKYGEHALQSLPAHALLLSHTDLDWNPIRYLRNCEGLRSDVTHLSLQMMPYPWFPSRQAHLYSNVSFPNLMVRKLVTASNTTCNITEYHHLSSSICLPCPNHYHNHYLYCYLSAVSWNIDNPNQRW